jgi:hypothetical protein
MAALKFKKLIKELVKDGTTLSNHPDLSNYIFYYYSTLYQRDNATKHSTQAIEARLRVLAVIPSLVSPTQNTKLTRPFTILELTAAVEALTWGKAPGPDGIPMEFLKDLWEFLASNILQLVNHIFSSLHLGPVLSTSIIVIIPKGSQHNLLGNWRPIALLNSLYKIITKTLANRLKEGISGWVSNSQSAYVPGRNIFDNLFFAQKTLVWAEESSQDTATILLDFVKAFDRLSWSFLESILAAKGFSPLWITWMRTIYCHGTTSVLVNGQPIASFPLQHGVR